MTRVVLVVLGLVLVAWLASGLPAGHVLAPARHVPEKKSAREVDHLDRAGYLAFQRPGHSLPKMVPDIH